MANQLLITMFHHYHISHTQSLTLTAGCVAILLLCFALRPFTHQGKQTITGLFGIVVGVVIGLLKLLFYRN